MPDRQKVIKGLEYHLKELTVGKTCFECPYFGDNPCEIQLIANALDLLKEQEAKETMVVESTNVYTGLPISHCPKCGVSLDRYLYGRQYEGEINYCPFCGQAIKWE